MDIETLKNELRNDEGVRHVPYKDSLGNWTCGVGHLMEKPPRPKEYWSDDKIDTTLDEDIKIALADIQQEPWYKACDTDARQRALMNMRFQLGAKGLREFVHSLAFITNRQWKEAADHLHQSLWYSQTTARAERVIRMIENG